MTSYHLDQNGFTLIEVLVSISIFALVAAISYSVIDTAGTQLVRIKEVRLAHEQSSLMFRQLRTDIAYISKTEDKSINQFKVTSDQRGGGAFDRLHLIVRLPESAALSAVDYFIDEASNMLVREVTSPWSRSESDTLRWNIKAVESFDIKLINKMGEELESWSPDAKDVFPLAIRIEVKDQLSKWTWTLPISVNLKEKGT